MNRSALASATLVLTAATFAEARVVTYAYELTNFQEGSNGVGSGLPDTLAGTFTVFVDDAELDAAAQAATNNQAPPTASIASSLIDFDAEFGGVAYDTANAGVFVFASGEIILGGLLGGGPTGSQGPPTNDFLFSTFIDMTAADPLAATTFNGFMYSNDQSDEVFTQAGVVTLVPEPSSALACLLAFGFVGTIRRSGLQA